MAAADGPKVTLYWLNKSRSQRVLWLLEECKLSYDVKIFKRKKDQLAPPELKKAHPLGKSPTISIAIPGKDEPMVLAESGFIFEYLIEHFRPDLVPAKWKEGQEGKVGGETESWVRYRYLMHFSEGTFMPFMVLKLITETIRKAPVPFFIRPITNQVAKQIEGFVLPNIQQNFELLEQYLATSPDNGKYLCGPKLTGADMMLSFPLAEIKSQPLFDSKKFPHIAAYSDLLRSDANYVAAVKKIEELDGHKYEPF